MSVTAVFNLRFVWFERAARDDVRQLDDAPVRGGVLTSPLGGAQALAAPTHTTCSECVEPVRAPSSRRGASQPCDLWLWLWLVPTSLYICFIVKPAVFFHKENWKYYINYIYYFPNKSFNLYLLITFYNLCLRKTPLGLIAFML